MDDQSLINYINSNYDQLMNISTEQLNNDQLPDLQLINDHNPHDNSSLISYDDSLILYTLPSDSNYHDIKDLVAINNNIINYNGFSP